MDTLYDSDRITRWLLPDVPSGIAGTTGTQLSNLEWCHREAERIGGAVGADDGGHVAVYRPHREPGQATSV